MYVQKYTYYYYVKINLTKTTHLPYILALDSNSNPSACHNC